MKLYRLIREGVTTPGFHLGEFNRDLYPEDTIITFLGEVENKEELDKKIYEETHQVPQLHLQT